MTTAAWTWQNVPSEGFYSEVLATAFMADGHPVLAGYEQGPTIDEDFIVFKLDALDGTILWEWKEGSENEKMDRWTAAAAGDNGAVVLAGWTEGDWARNGTNKDFAVAMLSSEGDVVWRWQNGSSGFDTATSVASTSDGGVVIGGYSRYSLEGLTRFDFTVVKLDGDGGMIWQWTDGSMSNDKGKSISVAPDGSIVLAGSTIGNWNGTSAGSADFAVTMLDADGNEIWRWQDGTAVEDVLHGSVVHDDGSITVSGTTFGSYAGESMGGFDFVVIKLDADGHILWYWQNGTEGNDKLLASAAGAEDGSLIVGGSTYGNWSASNKGAEDLVALKLAEINGSVDNDWSWQNGTAKQDVIFGVASREDGRVIFAGSTQGSFGRLRGDAQREAMAVMLQEGDYESSRSPTFAPTPATSSLLATAPPSVSSTMLSDGPTMMSSAAPTSEHSAAPTSEHSAAPSIATTAPMVMTSPTATPITSAQPTAPTGSTPSPQETTTQDESGGGSSGTDGAIIGGAVAAAVVVVAVGVYAGYRMRTRSTP